MRKGSARRVWLTVCLLASLGACTRGKTKEPPPPVREDKRAPERPAPANTDWIEGNLPASITTGPAVPGGQLVVAIESDPPSLNTILDAEQLASWITDHRVYESLIRLDVLHPPNYDYVPELAERWEISDDRKTYTFHLRKGVRFHDGKEFSARDVVATFDKIQDKATRGVHFRSLLEELESYSAPDDSTFVMRWKRPYAFAFSTLSDINLQPAHVIGKQSGREYDGAATNPINRAPIGTGPFRFTAWESNSKIALERNSGYWGEKPLLDRLVFRIVPNPTVRMQLAERGEIDVWTKVTSDQWRDMTSPTLRENWNRSRFFPQQYVWIGWNQERELFRDKRVRRALTMLVDRPGIIEKLMFGLPRPTTCHFYWASSQCDPELTPLPYDPPAAMRELEAAGWKDSNGDGVRDRQGKPFQFVFMIPSASEEAARWGAKVKEDFARAGIAMDLQRVEWSAFYKRLIEHNFDACTLIWSNTSPHEDPTQIWSSGAIKGGSNFVSFRNAEVDALIQQGRVEFDVAVRDGLFRKLGAILHDEQPYTWMYNRADLNLLHKRVKGARANLAGWHYESIWIDPKLRRD